MKANNSKTNKITNRNNILKMLALNAPISRIELSRCTGLSKMSLTNIITEFNEMELINEKGLDLAAIGKRKPVLLELNNGCICSVGINITRNYIESCLADIKGNMLFSNRTVFEEDLNEQKLISYVTDAIKTVLNFKEDHIVGIGISCIGPVDMKNGRILKPTNFYGIENVDIVKIISSRFALPVYLFKNTNCAVLAEKYYGLGKGISNFAYLGVSRGVGCSVVANDCVLIGANGYANEIGHLSININGEKCACGNNGCLEIYANLVDCVKKAEKLIEDGEKTILSSKISFEKIVNAAKENDNIACKVLDNLCQHLAIGIINIINIYDPSLIIIGNDIAVGGEEIIKRLNKFVSDIPMNADRRNVMIRISEFYDKAPLLGSSTLVFERLYFA